VSVLGDDAVRESSLEGLRSAHGFLQGVIASQLSLKHTPALTFHYDDSVDRGMRISELLDEQSAQGREGKDG
jgi:ribosome-binding factor A